jgi:stage IV sporulation protein FB
VIARWLAAGPSDLRFRVHALVPVAAAAAFLLGDFGWRYVMLLGCLVWHETAHAVAARALGARRAMVSLWPWFGKADVERLGGWREAVVALAAPAANLAVAGLLALACGARPVLRLGAASAADFALTANLLMGAINLIPVGPLDGGRALRALLGR